MTIHLFCLMQSFSFFFFNDTATTEIYTLSLHDALPISDYAQPNPPARILDALIAGEIDVAVVWGPLAGYFARRLPAPLAFAPVTPAADPPGLRFAFAMAAGVRRDDVALRDGLQAALDRRADEVRAILDAYGVPRLAEPPR